MSITISRHDWGTTDKGESLYLFKLQNSSGAYAKITNYGATIVNIVVPNGDGKLGSVVIGFDEPQAYLEDSCYIGSTIGRVANRISNSQFELNGQTYKLEANDGPNSNHGAISGFNYRVFGFEMLEDKLVMVLHSHDGDGGFPGNLTLRVIYEWTEYNTLKIDYHAACEQDTIANFTNHAYFNLSDGAKDIGQHYLTISSTTIVESGEGYIPTGKVRPAAELAFQNNQLNKKIDVNGPAGEGINSFYVFDDQLLNSNGYAALLRDEQSGRTLEVHTSYTGVFLYTGDYLNSKHPNHHGRLCQPFEGLCLECQLYPDAINQPGFPPIILPAHKVYNHFIHYKFGIE